VLGVGVFASVSEFVPDEGRRLAVAGVLAVVGAVITGLVVREVRRRRALQEYHDEIFETEVEAERTWLLKKLDWQRRDLEYREQRVIERERIVSEGLKLEACPEDPDQSGAHAGDGVERRPGNSTTWGAT
jgi:hypothetical protein